MTINWLFLVLSERTKDWFETFSKTANFLTFLMKKENSQNTISAKSLWNVPSVCPNIYTVSFVDLFLIYNASFCTWRNIKIYSKEAQIWGVIHSCIIAVKTVIKQAFVCLLGTFTIWVVCTSQSKQNIFF